MSLVVWLPLIENKNNQGTNPSLKFSYDNLTQQSDGKLGKCYSGQAIYHLNNEFLGNKWSLCAWVKSASWSQYNDIILCKNTSESTSSQFYFSIIGGTTFNIGINGGSNSASVAYTFATNTWYHVAATYNGSIYTLYINGEQKKTGTITNALITGMNNLCINCRSTNAVGTSQTGDSGKKLNDVRIYDECLSPLQVHELAQGLVLHYKLNNYNTLNNYNNTVLSSNVYTYPTFNTSTATGGWNHWGPSGGSPAYGQNTDKQYIYYKENTYSHWISEGEGTGKYYLVYQTPASPGGYRSLQCILKDSNSAEIKTSGTFVWPTLNSRTGGAAANTWTSVTYLGDGFYYCLYEGVIQSEQTGTNALFGIGVSPGHKVYISVMYLENAETCTSIFNNFTTIKDNSGYQNDGIINGTFSSLNNTSKYNNSLIFNGVDNAIKIPFNNIIKTDDYTVSVWTYKTVIGNKNYQTILGGPSGFELEARSSSSTSPLYRIHNWGGGTTAYEFNKWNLFTFVRTASDSKLYVNGELKLTGTTGTIPTGNYFIGAWNNATSQNFEGQMSDFRLYATALTVDDVKNLYETSMFIDNNGNILPFELSENNSNYIEKTGTLNDNIIEPFITLSDGSNWQLLLFHKVDNGTRLFTSSNATYCNNYGLFSRLAYINNFTYNNKYEFYVIQDGKEFRWTQTSQPTASSIAGKTVISGYLDPVNGLAKASQSNTYIGYNAWWGACGCWTQYSTGGKTGIPGFGSHDANGMCTDYLALYARIEKPYVFKENNSIQANEFIER